MEERVRDYEKILEECGLGELSASEICEKLSDFGGSHDSKVLEKFYNYCLLNVIEPEVLGHIVRLADLNRNEITLGILLKLLKERSLEGDLSDEWVNFRVICVKAIANYKDTSALVTLLDCMNNKKEHYRVRLACADALGRIGDKYAVRPLIDVVEDEEEKSVYLKESAAFALGMLGDTSAIDPLVSILESKQGFLDKFSFLKEKIVEALGKLNFNNKKVIRALKHSLMDSSPMVRINAIEAVMNSGEEDSSEIIRPCLSDEDDEVKLNALIAMYNLCGREILDEIIELPVYSEFLKGEAQKLLEEYERDEEIE